MNIYMRNNITGEIATIKTGFNWGVFFFGAIYYLVKGLTVRAIVAFIIDPILAICTLGIGNLFLGVHRGANWKNHYSDHLTKNDFVVYERAN
jgi:hypothetical protein